MHSFNPGIGADDAFIFVKLWNCSIIERVKTLGLPVSSSSSFATNASYPDTLAGLLATTLKHAATSMLVTSLTTSLAFYTSYLSAITAIRCFGYFFQRVQRSQSEYWLNCILHHCSIFAGTAVLINYLFMVTWLPAAVSINERSTCSWHMLKCGSRCIQKTVSMSNQLADLVQDLFVSAVTKAPYLWIILFSMSHRIALNCNE